MRSAKYPLEALADLREASVTAAARALAVAVREREVAARARIAAQALRDAHARAEVTVRAAERGALERGDLCAVDLARESSWAVRVVAERAALTAGLGRAQAAEASAAQREDGARGEVGSSRAGAQVVARHRAGWDATRRKELEGREEEASSEAWRRKA